jgi:hypothetical protein
MKVGGEGVRVGGRGAKEGREELFVWGCTLNCQTRQGSTHSLPHSLTQHALVGRGHGLPLGWYRCIKLEHHKFDKHKFLAP